MKRRVWIVDDSAVDATRAVRALGARYHVDVFDDGTGVIERLHQPGAPPDIIVLDWLMPGVTGVDVCRFLRADPAHAAIGLLMLTAHRAKEQIVEALASGANDFLAKPFDEEELVARVAALVRTRELLDRVASAEALNRSILTSAPDPLFALDDDVRVSFVNRAGADLLGAPAAALVGRPLHEVLPELATLSPAHAQGDDVTIGDRVFSPSVQSYADQQLPTTLSLREVTDRRSAELRRLDLYSVVAHDLRSPLNVISLRTQRVLSGRDGAVPPRIVENLRKIDDSVRALVCTINDFLDLASLEGPGLARKAVRLCRVVDRVQADFAPLIDANEIAWHVDCAADLVVEGDARRLAQVLKNLVSNALKYTPPRGRVEVCVARHGRSARVTVRDTGRGIAPADLPSLFQRYSRAGSSGDVAGSGLGLMIVREIVQAHGGDVGVDSTLGSGSSFWFTLPLHPSDGSSDAGCEPGSGSSGTDESGSFSPQAPA